MKSFAWSNALVACLVGAGFAGCSESGSGGARDTSSGPTAGADTTSSTTSPNPTTTGGSDSTVSTVTSGTTDSTASTTTTTSTTTQGAGGTTTTTTSTSMGGATTTTTTASGGSGGTGGGGACDTLVTPIERGGEYVLEFGDTYFAAVPAGGKIVEFRRAAGSNLLTGNNLNETNFGSTLWTAPQADWDWPPVVEIDSEAYTVSVDEGTATITMTSGVATSIGPMVSVSKQFVADLCGGAVDVTYTVTNEDASAQSYAPWEVTRVAAGGLGFFQGTRSGFDTDVLPVSDSGGAMWFDHPASSSPNMDQKLFADATAGFLAVTNGTDLLVKTFSDVPANAQAPVEAEIELYDGGTYVEYELQGVYGAVDPGASVSLTVRWIVRPFPDGATKAVGDATLLSAATGLL